MPSPATSTADGSEPVPVAHACGHDMLQRACSALRNCSPTLKTGGVAPSSRCFSPRRKLGDDARGMISGGLRDIVSHVDVALSQHVGPFPAGTVATHAGPAWSAADSMPPVRHCRTGTPGDHAPACVVPPGAGKAQQVYRTKELPSTQVGSGAPRGVPLPGIRRASDDHG